MVKTLNNHYSTTKLCYKLLDDKYLDKNEKIREEYKFTLNFPEFGIVNSKISAKENEKFDTYLFLSEEENRKGEGGLRTKGFFKFSYEKKDDKWWIVEKNKYIKRVDLNEKIVKSYDKLPLITIITVVYNGEKYLEETIKSIINQNYPNVEYIIIDGGSTDRTIDIIKKYEDKIDYWVSEKDKGIYDAMNKGIDLASGKWINFMNAGDRLLYLEERDLFEKSQTYSNYFYDYEKKDIFRKPLSKMYLTHNMVCHQSIIYKWKDIKYNKYDVNYKIEADFIQLLKILNSQYDFEKGSSIIFYNHPGESSEFVKQKSCRKLYNRCVLIRREYGLIYFIFCLFFGIVNILKSKIK